VNANSLNSVAGSLRLLEKLPLTVSISNEMYVQTEKYVQLLLTWSKALNLTAIKDPDDIFRLHVADSASIEPYLRGGCIADVGTGAGFPGMILAILHPEKKFTLIESVTKKASFIRNAVSVIGIKNVEVLNQRCEQIKGRKFDCIVSRAFASLKKMTSLCRELVSENGIFLAMKGRLSDEEVQELPPDIKVEKKIPVAIPGTDVQRTAVILRITKD